MSCSVIGSVYVLLDNVILGILSTTESVGFYSSAVKITKIPISLISSLGIVLIPKLWVNYNRITLVNLEIGERVTIDTGLEFIDTEKNKIALNNLVIAEVKQNKKNPSTFISAIKEFGIKPGSISKYCMAASYLNTQLKTNSFKLKLNQISKIITHELA
jgi:hypothetical protein